MKSGSVTHFEIPADNVERAERFYAESFGWNIQDMPEMSYAMLSTTPSGEDGRPKDPGAINGGMMKRSGMFTAPVVTIDVDDIDEALATVEQHGGTDPDGPAGGRRHGIHGLLRRHRGQPDRPVAVCEKLATNRVPPCAVLHGKTLPGPPVCVALCQ